MFSLFKRFSTKATPEVMSRVNELIKSNPIFIASKSYCPYCDATKKTFSKITKDAYIIELDEESDGSEIQAALREMTGQSTVPNVFIGGEHIGGNSDVQQLVSSGKLEEKVKAVL